jgi:ribosome-binding protein aMBF1 (putative translation factor)
MMATQRLARKNDWVRVKRAVQGKSEPVWIDGQVTESTGKGCFVKTIDGNRQFYHYAQIQLVDLKRPVKPLATIADAMKAKEDLAREIEKTPTTASLHVVPSAPSTPAPATSRPRRNPPVVTRMKNEHSATPIGARFRSERLRLGMYQYEFAEALAIDQAALSRIELGDQLPTDVVLAAFAKETSNELAELKRLRGAVTGNVRIRPLPQ